MRWAASDLLVCLAVVGNRTLVGPGPVAIAVERWVAARGEAVPISKAFSRRKVGGGMRKVKVKEKGMNE